MDHRMRGGATLDQAVQERGLDGRKALHRVKKQGLWMTVTVGNRAVAAAGGGKLKEKGTGIFAIGGPWRKRGPGSVS